MYLFSFIFTLFYPSGDKGLRLNSVIIISFYVKLIAVLFGGLDYYTVFSSVESNK